MLKQPLNKQQLHSCPIAWQAQLRPHAVAIQSPSQQISYLELTQYISSLGIQLTALNMKKGDRLVCIAQNCLQLVLLQLSCIRHGFIFCPINPKFSEAEIEQRLSQLASPFIWWSDTGSNLDLNFKLPLQYTKAQQPINIDPETIISIIFTSGSSGKPKAVMHHFSNHYYSALGSQSIIPIQQGDTNLLSLPIFHISGYATVMRTFLAGASLQICAEKIDVDYLQRAHITHLSLVSSQLQQLLDDDKFEMDKLSIKHLLLGGSAFPAKLLQKLATRNFTYHLSYGSTEMASQIATSTNNEQLQLLPYRQLKIIDGEIHLAGKTRFAGYFKGDTQAGLIDRKHYFPSCDLGELHANRSLRIIGRKDRQFISGGENIQPEEIEKALLTFPGVAQAYVLPIDDSVYGQRPIAFIKWQQHDQSAQLATFLTDKLIRFKQPVHYFELPAQQGIKIDAQQLIDSALKLLLIN